MPTCRRCGRDLVETDLNIGNWAEISKKKFYSCMKCGGNWLYSKSLNCPILIDTKNIIKQATTGRSRTSGVRSKKKSTSGQELMTSAS